MKNWNIENETGYKPITTYYADFSIAETFGTQAIKDTYTTAFNEYINDYKILTELVMVLNWKIWEHYETNKKIAELYDSLWKKLDLFCCENLKGEELNYFYSTTD